MTGTPAWLQPPKTDTSDFYNEWTWEEILRRVSEGHSIASLCREPEMPQNAGKLLRWIMNDVDRKDLYYKAQAIGTEMLTDKMMSIADAEDDPMEDVQRSTLRVNTHKWVISARNRDRFGDKKQIEQTVTVNISDAMENAQKRVADLRQPLLIEGDVVNG